MEGALRLTAVFSLARPKTGKRVYPSVKPDIDNLSKAILDGCNQAGVWGDDAQVVEMYVTKVYGQPSTTVEIEAIA